MPRRSIVITDGDDVIIDLGGRHRAPPRSRINKGRGEGSPPSIAAGKGRRDGGDSLCLTARVKNLIELRAEASFRANQPDFEVIYALSGADYWGPDTFHHFASQRVVEDASPATVTPIVTGIMDLIRRDREGSGSPMLIVINHTHPAPGNIPQPSSNDERFFQSTSQVLADMLPKTRILFGVHAISGEAVRRREPPTKTTPNCIRWASVIREHEVAFFAPDGTPFPVDYVE